MSSVLNENEMKEIRRLIQVAKLYYQLNYSQNKIAKELGISRPSVSRLLQEAKDKGIVTITINDSLADVQKHSEAIKERYGLKACIIANVPKYEEEIIKQGIGKAAANYVRNIVKAGDIISATWGTTIFEVARNMQYKNVNGVKVVQLNGGVTYSETNTYATEILQYLGKAFDTSPYYLPLPAVVDDETVKKVIMGDRHIRSVLNLAQQANIALFTVGDRNKDSALVKVGYLMEQDLIMLEEMKFVGDICSRFIDIDGNICCQELNTRTIGIELDELTKKEQSILVAGGYNKIDGIIGALKGKYANVLVTDQYTAEELLINDAQ